MQNVEQNDTSRLRVDKNFTSHRKRIHWDLLAADHFIAVVFSGKRGKGGVDDTTSQTQHKVKRAFFLDVVVAQSATIRKLLASKN